MVMVVGVSLVIVSTTTSRGIFLVFLVMVVTSGLFYRVQGSILNRVAQNFRGLFQYIWRSHFL